MLLDPDRVFGLANAAALLGWLPLTLALLLPVLLLTSLFGPVGLLSFALLQPKAALS